MTDDEVVQIAREAYRREAGVMHLDGLNDACASRLFHTILGARAVAAKLSGGAGEPVAVATLSAALLWARNHLDCGDVNIGVRDRVIETLDRVLKHREPTLADVRAFKDFYGISTPPAESAVVPAYDVGPSYSLDDPHWKQEHKTPTDYWLHYDHQTGRWCVENEPPKVIRTGAEIIHTRVDAAEARITDLQAEVGRVRAALIAAEAGIGVYEVLANYRAVRRSVQDATLNAGERDAQG